MPESRTYVVQQIREVEVRATSCNDAVRIASAAFTNGQNADSGVVAGPVGVWGNTVRRIRETSLVATEKRP